MTMKHKSFFYPKGEWARREYDLLMILIDIELVDEVMPDEAGCSIRILAKHKYYYN